MWSREELKGRAKGVLRKWYWMAFLVSLLAFVIINLVSGGAGSGIGRGEWRLDTWDLRHFNDWRFDNFNDIRGWSDIGALPGVLAVMAAVAAFASFIAAVGVTIGTLYRIFVGGPVEVGARRYYLDARQEKSDFVNLFYAFRNGRYLFAVKATAWQLLFTFLWTLLFLIPGIVKTYAYSMIPYIMADNPGMDYRRAMRLSMDMTRGEKWNIFVLDLSFLGWALLGVLTCSIGLHFLRPYYQATKAELYAVLRRNAIEKGLCTDDELNQAPAPAVI